MRDDTVILARQTVAPSDLAETWTFEPVVLGTLLVAAVVYGRGTARLGRRVPRPHATVRALAFHGGLAVVAVALMSPVDAAAASLFSGHMVQHLLLMIVAAPLLAYARPAAALLAGLPGRGRDAVRRASTVGLRGTLHRLWHPVVVWTLGTLALWAWHMPELYERALANDALHAAEHTSFLATALLFWAVVLSSAARRGVPRPIALILVFATGVQSTALGALLVFASTPLYDVHAEGARLWDFSLLQDQQLAGALMWGPPALLYLVTMGWLLVRWFAEMDASASPAPLVTAGEHA